MDKLSLNEIRERYLSFFQSKDHLRLPSFPLVPQKDASLLLINAGMAPLKSYFTGKEIPPAKRMTTCQKCIRTPDIERVGKTARHGTFFEMLGNFSFGDYFKKEATAWAWEFITKEMKMPIDRLWVSIYLDDDEAFDIWTKEVGVSPDMMVRLGKADNFWEIGTGPCGPCSEIYFDRGSDKGCGQPNCAVGCDCDRFVEFWNLVFTQFDKDEMGNYNRLAKPNIDTGMGLERIAAIMQGVDSLFEVDTIRNIMEHIINIAKVKYGENANSDISLRVITDHVRSTVFLVCDGVIPSNEGRGYILRRLLRRAARHGKLLGIDQPFLNIVTDTVINESCEAYPELVEKREFIKKVIKIEEERFDETIDQGLLMIGSYLETMKVEKKNVLPGVVAFKLYDTFGFPIDLTREIVIENGFTIDEEVYNSEMTKQRERARAARNEGTSAGWDEDIFSKINKGEITSFVGYDKLNCEGTIIAVVKNNELVQNIDEEDEAVIISDKSAFYGESGGQQGDIGFIKSGSNIFVVKETQKSSDGKMLHYGKVLKGSMKAGDCVMLSVDADNRKSIERNHSSTHLLQKALRSVLGSHVAQSGSFVSSERLRFDFSHFQGLTKEELKKVEKEVNNAIFSAFAIEINEMSAEEAKKTGAMALFGEKYGDVVRVVKMGDYSTELCGGCHLKNTSEAGLFKIISEGGVAAGVRRIEAITGREVLKNINFDIELIQELSVILKSSKDDLLTKAQDLVNEQKQLKKEIEEFKLKGADGEADDLIANATKFGEVIIIIKRIDGLEIEGMRKLCDALKSKTDKPILIVFASYTDDKINFMAVANKSANDNGINCGNIIKEISEITGGRGGGRPDSAQAGGKDVSKINEALERANEIIKIQMKL